MIRRSPIKKKTGRCIDCTSGKDYSNGRDVPLTAGRCHTHYKIHRANVNQNKNQNRIAQGGGNRRKDLELGEWFEMVAEQIRKHPYCWNCHEFIPPSFYRAASAHILPKRKTYGFPSVATHPMNFIILGAGCGCHAKYDRSWDDAEQMPVFRVVKKRFKYFVDSLPPDDLRRVPECFLT